MIGSDINLMDRQDKCKLEPESTYLSESSIPYPSRADEYGIPPLAMEMVSDTVS